MIALMRAFWLAVRPGEVSLLCLSLRSSSALLLLRRAGGDADLLADRDRLGEFFRLGI